MKQLSIIVSLVMLVGILSAVDFDFSGNYRTRAAFHNNNNQEDGGFIDNRLQLGLDSQIADGLRLHALMEIGNLTWGSTGAGLSTGGNNVETDELYIDYHINALDANIKIGQQYWADHRSLILDDFFSGIMLSREDMMGMKVELGMIKVLENASFHKDDYNVFLANLQGETPIPFGLMAMAGYYADMNEGNATIMPYVTIPAGLATLDITPFLDYQVFEGADSEMGMGAAVKADVTIGTLQAGADVLYATKNGLTVLSPWYQNGLYLYGIGGNHDGVNLYWSTPYTYNIKNFFSAVGKFRAPLKENVTAFGAAGVLSDMGWEANAGVEYQVIPDTMQLSAFGAFGTGTSGTKPANYAIGTSIIINF